MKLSRRVDGPHQLFFVVQTSTFYKAMFMNLLTNLSKRIENFLSRNEKMIDRSFANVTDPRQSAKVIYQLPSVLKAILSGFLTNKQTLRAIESTCGSGAPMDGVGCTPLAGCVFTISKD